MQRIILIGSGGSGKSTLARELGARLGIDVHHLDALFWKPNWTPATRQEQLGIQSAWIERESWIKVIIFRSRAEVRLFVANQLEANT